MTETPGIALFRSAEHACGYWPERIARDVIADPNDPRLAAAYSDALARGYRRSGGYLYRPQCPDCQACIPVRLPVAQFVANRSQRRCLQRNSDLHVTTMPARRTDENFSLYQRYLAHRHAGGGMDEPSAESFDNFLTCAWSPTLFLEVRQEQQLLAVAVTDQVAGALSAVYTFFEPTLSARSLGTLSILQQIALAQELNLDYLYLGFWLKGHAKMDYKSNYQPLQQRVAEQWCSFDNCV